MMTNEERTDVSGSPEHLDILRNDMLQAILACGRALARDCGAIGHEELASALTVQCVDPAIAAAENLCRQAERVRGIRVTIEDLAAQQTTAPSGSTPPAAAPSVQKRCANRPLALSDDVKRTIVERLQRARAKSPDAYAAEREAIRKEFPGVTGGTLAAILASATRKQNGGEASRARKSTPKPKRRSGPTQAAARDRELTIVHRDDIVLEVLRAEATHDANGITKATRDLAEKYERSEEVIRVVVGGALRGGMKECAIGMLSRIENQRERTLVAKELIAIAQKLKQKLPSVSDLLHTALAQRAKSLRGS